MVICESKSSLLYRHLAQFTAHSRHTECIRLLGIIETGTVQEIFVPWKKATPLKTPAKDFMGSITVSADYVHLIDLI